MLQPVTWLSPWVLLIQEKLKVLATCMVHYMAPKDLGFAGKRMVFQYKFTPYNDTF